MRGVTRHSGGCFALALAVLAGGCGGGGASSSGDAEEGATPETVQPSPPMPGTAFPGSAVSMAALGRNVLEAFVAGDSATLSAFRLSEEEHNGVVFPELPAGQPEVNYPVDLAWQNIELRNSRSLARQFARFEDRAVAFSRTVCNGETRVFRTFVVHTDCWVYLEDAQAGNLRIQIFKDVLERGGGFKVFRYYDESPRPEPEA